MLILKYGIFEGYLQFHHNKTQNIVFIFFKTNPNVFVVSKLFEHAFDTKTKKILIINLVSIKRNTHINH